MSCFSVLLSILCVLALPCVAQDEAVDLSSARIIGGVSDGRPIPPVPPKVLPQFKINWSVVHQKKDHRVIINKVQAPARIIQQPTEPLSAGEAALRHKEIEKWVHDRKEWGGGFMVSATIYDHRVTYVRWWHKGEEYAAFSNVDWSHLGGFHEFEGRGKRYHMMLFSGNVSMLELRREIRAGYRATLPDIHRLPKLSERGAAYTMVKGDEENEEAMEFIEAIHDLYGGQRVKLVHAWREREKNYRIYRKMQEELRENPPPKKDVIINYWKIRTSKKDQSPTK